MDARSGKEKTYKPPTKCPACSQAVEHFEGEVAWYCVNAACPAQLVRNIEHFVSRGAMDIVGLGIKIVEQLIEAGLVKDVADLFALNKDQLLELEGFAEKKAENLLKSLEQAKGQSLDVYKRQTWNYYSSKFGRDSYDGRGGLIRATIVNKNNCGWNGYIECGSSYVALDVLAHEVSHGLTQYTSQFIYDGEAGALNEGISDTMAAAIDSDDWLMGEESDVGAIRSLQNPPQFRNPDSMVSSHYYCGGDYNTYVHVNSGVLNKAFYLMSDGGSHKGCQMQGIGRDAAAALLYKALTTYMKGRPNSQYLDMYNGLNSSCGDIYGATSATCANIKVALQSVLMDKPSKCKGGSASTPASCVGVQPGTPEPTGTQPTPTTGAPTSAPTPTSGTQPQGTRCV